MARLKLASNANLKDLGHAVVAAAKVFYEADGNLSANAKVQIENEIKNCLDTSGKQINLHFHYDQTSDDTTTGQTVTDLHVVIPDLSGKARETSFVTNPFDLADVAAESIGYVVIMGCGD